MKFTAFLAALLLIAFSPLTAFEVKDWKSEDETVIPKDV